MPRSSPPSAPAPTRRRSGESGGLAVTVAHVVESPGRFALRAENAWWTANRDVLPDQAAALVAPIELDLEGYRLGQRLLFRGSVAGRLELACGRCVEPFEHPLDERLELLLEPLPSPAPDRSDGGIPEGGIELDAEDLEIGQYGGEELDFSVVLREILVFNWPMQPRCEEGCLGLCPSCGVNRNRESCQCGAEKPQGPFAELGKLLGQSGIKAK